MLNIITLAALAPFVWYGVLFAHDYYAATGTIFGRSVAAIKSSWTVFVSQAVFLVTGLMSFIGKVAETVTSDPTIGDKIQQGIPPQYVAYGAIGMAFLFLIARMRTLGKEPAQ